MSFEIFKFIQVYKFIHKYFYLYLSVCICVLYLYQCIYFYIRYLNLSKCYVFVHFTQILYYTICPVIGTLHSNCVLYKYYVFVQIYTICIMYTVFRSWSKFFSTRTRFLCGANSSKKLKTSLLLFPVEIPSVI